MEKIKITPAEKKPIKMRLLGFKKTGLLSYQAYLEKELESASKSENKEAYTKYITKELSGTHKKLKKIESKLIKYNS